MKERQIIPIAELNIEQARKELSFLERDISYHDDLYYYHSEPQIPDYEYDELKKRCDAIARAFPDLARPEDPNGPLNKIGAERCGSLFKITHLLPMLSLEKVCTRDDIKKFITKTYRLFHRNVDNSIFFTLEPKIDGVAVDIRYEKGKFVSAALRGNGDDGRDVSAHILSLPSAIPLNLPSKFPDILELRCEIYITKNDFLALNDEMIALKRKPYANPRNTASAVFRCLNPTHLIRYLNLFVYGLGYTSDIFAENHYEMLQTIRDLGFPVNDKIRQTNTLKGIMSYYSEMQSIRSSLPYDIDGVVYKVDDFFLQKQLGVRKRSPRWMISHKFHGLTARTRLLDIDIQIGRTGIISPVARLEPVSLGGVIITNATLHNEDYIKGLDASGKLIREGRDIRVGDTVIVTRAGDVIPRVVDVIIDERPLDAQVFSFPSSCPICNSRVVRDLNMKTRKVVAAHRCTGGILCSAQQLEYLKHFVSLNAFDIAGLGEKQLDFFFKSEDPDISIKIPADIFTLQRRQQTATKKLENISGFGYVSVSNLYDAINKRRNISLQRFIFSLGIRCVGIEIAGSLAKYYLSYQNLEKEINNIIANANANANDAYFPLKKVPLVGDIAAQAIIEFYQNSACVHATEELLKEVTPSISNSRDKNYLVSIFKNKKIAFTGTLKTIKRHKAKEYVEQLGAVVSNTISRQTDMIIVGDNPGSKLNEASRLGVRIIDEKQFISSLEEYAETLLQAKSQLKIWRKK
ncbi:NAD-dependent DNA ligase LigA [Candidatus Liberibacter africanus]|uniref:DNA ligase n=1 Tax=Candidatus Liberibacter africanus PTSAPSY TaxID=1277257 RepID=A0A0G3I9P8_LIBAF|nr:NAD-dependent DNA ligase LigA [Candidatus Liberibacter africanus]AKK20512.1 NAD-dependent DNA ligase LigA [Candidatus Liberibacter africanus PTSAPSY]QTP64222.1 NAD-dependent DNA ligase LigA [Candidatus Liberibacter africanus]